MFLTRNKNLTKCIITFILSNSISLLSSEWRLEMPQYHPHYLRLHSLPTQLVQNSTTQSGSDRTGREELSMLIEWTKNVHENKFYVRKWLHDSFYSHSVVI